MEVYYHKNDGSDNRVINQKVSDIFGDSEIQDYCKNRNLMVRMLRRMPNPIFYREPRRSGFVWVCKPDGINAQIANKLPKAIAKALLMQEEVGKELSIVETPWRDFLSLSLADASNFILEFENQTFKDACNTIFGAKYDRPWENRTSTRKTLRAPDKGESCDYSQK